MNTETVYKKFKDLDQLYSYIRKIEPNMEEWGCVGPITGTGFSSEAMTRVWPSEFGGGRSGFIEAFQYVCGDFLDGEDFKPGVKVKIDLVSGKNAKGKEISGGYVGAEIADEDRKFSVKDILKSMIDYENENNFYNGSVEYDDDDEDGEVIPLDKIPPKLITPAVFLKALDLADKDGIDFYPRDVLEALPASAFSPQVKKKLFDKDPDVIFYMNPDAVTEKDALYAIDKAGSGFSSPPSDQPEELPSNFPQNVMSKRVIDALKTKLNIPDKAFNYLMPSQLQGTKLFDKALELNKAGVFDDSNELPVYEKMFKDNVDLDTPENRKLIGDKITNQIVNYGDSGGGYSTYSKQQLGKYLTPQDMNRILKSLAARVNNSLDGISALKQPQESYNLTWTVKGIGPDNGSPEYQKLFPPQNVQLLKAIHAKMDPAEKAHEIKYKEQQDRESTPKSAKPDQSPDTRWKDSASTRAEIQKNPSAIWEVPKDLRTPELWLVAAQGRPDVITFAPKDIKDYVSAHLNKANDTPGGAIKESDLGRMIKLAGLK